MPSSGHVFHMCGCKPQLSPGVCQVPDDTVMVTVGVGRQGSNSSRSILVLTTHSILRRLLWSFVVLHRRASAPGCAKGTSHSADTKPEESHSPLGRKQRKWLCDQEIIPKVAPNSPHKQHFASCGLFFPLCLFMLIGCHNPNFCSGTNQLSHWQACS